ncbi:MAG: hypothetical protein ACTSUE_17210 [Promethearchaeota archaeon]
MDYDSVLEIRDKIYYPPKSIKRETFDSIIEAGVQRPEIRHIDARSSKIKDLSWVGLFPNVGDLAVSLGNLESLKDLPYTETIYSFSIHAKEPWIRRSPDSTHINVGLKSLDGLQNLPNLKRFVVFGCNLRALDPVTCVKDLKILAITDGKVESIEPLRAMEGLLTINLANNKICDPTALSTIPSITEAFLKNNPFESLPSFDHHMSIIDFSNCSVTDETFDTFSTKSCMKLDISYNKLTHLDLHRLIGFFKRVPKAKSLRSWTQPIGMKRIDFSLLAHGNPITSMNFPTTLSLNSIDILTYDHPKRPRKWNEPFEYELLFDRSPLPDTIVDYFDGKLDDQHNPVNLDEYISEKLPLHIERVLEYRNHIYFELTKRDIDKIRQSWLKQERKPVNRKSRLLCRIPIDFKKKKGRVSTDIQFFTPTCHLFDEIKPFSLAELVSISDDDKISEIASNLHDFQWQLRERVDYEDWHETVMEYLVIKLEEYYKILLVKKIKGRYA